MERSKSYRKTINILFRVLAFLVLSACKPAAAPIPVEDQQPLPAVIVEGSTVPATENTLPDKGIIHPALKCAKAEDVTYSIYIPQSCKSGNKWPFLLLFDPQGNGRKPLELYKDLAEKHGIVLMCSNTSKNGNTPVITNRIIYSLFVEINKQYPADTNRIYCGGFSGGGRVATMCQATHPELKGIITIGAASLPANAKSLRYIAIAGRQDFNYREVVETGKNLNAKNNDAVLLFHNGIHEWCPVLLFDKALLLLDADAMRAGTLTMKTEYLLKEAVEARQDAGAMERSGDIRTAADRLAFAKICLKDISTDKKLDEEYQKISSSPLLVKANKDAVALDQEQDQMTSLYLQKVGEPIAKWKDYITKINAELVSTKESPRHFMLKRMMSTLSIQVYSSAKQYIYGTDLSKAAYLSELYLLIDPTNKEAHYFSAILAARNNNPSKVFDELEQSVKYGLADREKLMNEKDFQSYHSDEKFNKILREVELAQSN
ncbi:MAG: hypothetical protein ABI772_13685 [Bacteroidota bacterium]